MRKTVFGVLAALVLATSVSGILVSSGCASSAAQATEFKTVSAAVAGVETARSGYQDLRNQCTANPAATTLCTKIIAAHDSLATAYSKYQAAVQALADANVALLNATAPNATLQQQVTAATAGLLSVATDFVNLESTTTKGN